MCTEAEHLSEIYDDYQTYSSYAEYITDKEYERLCTLQNLAGTRVCKKKRCLNKKDKNLYLIIQDSRKDNTTLMLVDRRKSKGYWRTHDFSIAYKGNKEDMKKAAKKLKKNNVRVVSYEKYLNSL